jgi:type II secretory pathway component GspD/PulD (secretin)
MHARLGVAGLHALASLPCAVAFTLVLALAAGPAAAEGLGAGQDAPPQPDPNAAPQPTPAQETPGEKPDDKGLHAAAGRAFFLSDEKIRNEDGTVTWFYWTNHIGAQTLETSIKQLKVPGLQAALTTAVPKRDQWILKYSPRTPDRRLDTGVMPEYKPNEPDQNVLILTYPEAYQEIVTEFLDRLDTPEPQVYIQAKVVEVTLDSNLEYGTSLFFDRGAGDPATGTPGGENPNSFFRSFRSSFRPGSFTQPFLSPANTGLGLLFDDLSMDEGTIVAQIEALQQRGRANILSEPSIVATQGQLATLLTGQETPVQQIKITGASETITTEFKQTGIRLDFTPLHVGREYVKLRVRVEVSSITGFLQSTGPTTSVQNPVISQRNAETIVSIRDGMTLVIGGLYSVSLIEDRAGVPILADIPILNFLFSKRRKTEVKSELNFFITPHVLRQRLAKTVFQPPGEKERLKKVKETKRDGKKEPRRRTAGSHAE